MKVVEADKQIDRSFRLENGSAKNSVHVGREEE